MTRCKSLAFPLVSILLSGLCLAPFLTANVEASGCEAVVLETIPDVKAAEQAIELHEGMVLRLSVMDSLSSEHSRVGDAFTARVALPFQRHDMSKTGVTYFKDVLSSHDLIKGRVLRAEPAVNGRGGRLSLAIDKLMLDNGLAYDVDASVLYFQEKAFFGGEGTEGTTPVVFPTRLQGYPHLGRYQFNYNRYRLLGAKQPGEPFNLLPGDMLVIRLNKPVTLYRY